MLIRTITIIFLAFLSGCTTINHIPLTPDASRQLQDKSVVLTIYPIPDFAASTPGKAMFGILGAFTAISEGNSLIQENDVQDPAIAIGQGIVDRLVATRNATQVSSLEVATSDDIQTLLATYPGTNTLVDVKTFNWMFVYYPTQWGRYRVIHSARVRLIDGVNKEVMAETLCSFNSDDANPPTEDQLLKNKAALLKKYLKRSATSCIDQVTKDLLLISSKP